jgi:hypothetical protein
MNKILLCVLFMGSTALYAQSYFVGSFAAGFPAYKQLNSISQTFDATNNHRLGDFNFLTGFEIGVGLYGPRTMMEAKYASIGQRLESKIPDNFIENASVEYHYNYINYSFGYRPFTTVYFTIGGGLNVGKIDSRYSYGGDWVVTTEDYAASTEIFMDYAFPIKLKKRRSPYFIRVRPYYQQMFGATDFHKLDAAINEKAPLDRNAAMQDLSHGGVRISLIVPFGKDKKIPKVAPPVKR